MVDELITNTVQEHLLLEFTFETVLKSLLGESSKKSKPEPKPKPIDVKRQPSRIPILSPRPDSLSPTKTESKDRREKSYSKYLTT